MVFSVKQFSFSVHLHPDFHLLFDKCSSQPTLTELIAITMFFFFQIEKILPLFFKMVQHENKTKKKR